MELLRLHDRTGQTGERPNQSAQAWEGLRADILEGRLRPNARLRLEELRSRYNVGISPLREALMRLQAEGLVVLQQNKGFRVLPATQEHLADVCAVRTELECLALRWSIERGDVAWEAGLLSALHKLSREAKMDGDGNLSRAWCYEHRCFHAALVSGGNSPVLESVRVVVFEQSERYVALSIGHMRQPRDDVDEHAALVEASLARDVEKACALCRQHIMRTFEKASAALSS
ncbi:MAG TPA: FCD domain-containing protein [Xanthobacteraceae bacterium]|jgi:DNA-binding GntR family transcriptional regulator|nr:FCD domain-containing protein [Xanthobacteraceae bacterium]